MKKLLYIFITTLVATTSLFLASCSKDDNGGFNVKIDYDVIQINGEKHACYGHRCPMTYTSTWSLSDHSGKILLPCGKLSDAQKGEYDYDILFDISLSGNQDLKKGSKLEDFTPTFNTPPTFNTLGEWYGFDYAGGSATIIDKKDDKYITIKFDSFKFKKGSKSYTLNGTAQLSFDED